MSRRTVILTLLVPITLFALVWLVIDTHHTYQANRLSEAIHAEDIEAVERLLDEGVDPNWKNSYGKTSLRVAEQHPDLDILRLVERAGGDRD